MATIVRGIISVLFGNYPHGSDGTVQPIEWDVLKLMSGPKYKPLIHTEGKSMKELW